MSLYSYSALNGNNEIKNGIIDDIDKETVSSRLIMQGLRPLTIHPYTKDTPSLSPGRFRRNKVTKTDIDFFTKQIALLLSAGLSLDASLRVMNQHAHKPAFREVTGHIERGLKEGKSFSQALADHSRLFPPMYINMVKAGEEGGILPAMLKKISEYQTTFQELKQFIVSASIYPLILMVVGLAALTILITTILPRFDILFEGMDKELPLNVRILMDTAKFITDHYIFAALLLIGPPVAVFSYFRTKEGKILYDRLAIKTPLWGHFIRDLETTKIFRTLEVLVNNGVHLATALKISSGVAGNLAYQQLLQMATVALKSGQQIGKQLKTEGLFPDLAVDLLSIGEESGQVGQVCGQVADHFENELRTRIKRIIALIEPVFILTLAVVVGYVVISMLSVILSINEIAG
jgi:general secretion pathway protein F